MDSGIPAVRLDDWNHLVRPSVRAGFRRGWTPARPLGVGELPPYLEVLGDPSVPRVARWIAADAWVLGLPNPTREMVVPLVEWHRALPAVQGDDALNSLAHAAVRHAASLAAPAAPAQSGADARGAVAASLVAFGCAVAHQLPEPTLRTLAWMPFRACSMRETARRSRRSWKPSYATRGRCPSRSGAS